jgi:putative transposase
MPKADSGTSALASLLDGSTAGELIPEQARHGLQQLIELEVAAVLGADPHERSEERSGHQNGSRPRLLTTQVGDIPLSIPKLRSGSFFPTILETRRRIDQALYAVIMEAWVQSIHPPTWPQDSVQEALGRRPGGGDRLGCRHLPLGGEPYLPGARQPDSGSRGAAPRRMPLPVPLPQRHLPARAAGQDAAGLLQGRRRGHGGERRGRQELLGLKVGDSESEPFWREFLASLKQRSLTGIRLVISDAHVGLSKAVGLMLQGCSWQHCRVHFARNLLQTVAKVQQEMIAVALRSVFTHQNTAAVEEQWDQVPTMLAGNFPRTTELMATALEDVLTSRHYQASNWRKLWSTNLLERVNEKIKRRTRVVGIFPNDAALTRLVGEVLLEQDEHWQLEGRRMFSLDSMAAIPPNADALPEPHQETAAMP